MVIMRDQGRVHTGDGGENTCISGSLIHGECGLDRDVLSLSKPALAYDTDSFINGDWKNNISL